MTNSIRPLILIDCVGLLVDGRQLRITYQHNLAKVMTAQYGKTPDFWRAIDQQIVADWASYHADLNYSGDDGIDDMHEGIFRVTRALFRLANIPEPPKSEITALAKMLMTLPYDKRVLLPDVDHILAQWVQEGYQLATFAYVLHDQLKSITASLPMLNKHIGVDTVQYYDHDVNYFMKVASYLAIPAEQIIVLTRYPQVAFAISQAGLRGQVVQQLSASFIKTLER